VLVGGIGFVLTWRSPASSTTPPPTPITTRPTVTLGRWDGVSGYVDIDGNPVELPADPQARGVTRLSQDNRPVAVLIHDPMLDSDSALLEGLAASSLMMLENGRLVAELDASRPRIVKTAEQERRKLERLHDGALTATCRRGRATQALASSRLLDPSSGHPEPDAIERGGATCPHRRRSGASSPSQSTSEGCRRSLRDWCASRRS
jgi:hypothetical protein